MAETLRAFHQKVNPEFAALFEKTKKAIAEERTKLFEEKRGKFKSKAARKRYYDNQLEQIHVIKIEGGKE